MKIEYIIAVVLAVCVVCAGFLYYSAQSEQRRAAEATARPFVVRETWEGITNLIPVSALAFIAILVVVVLCGVSVGLLVVVVRVTRQPKPQPPTIDM